MSAASYSLRYTYPQALDPLASPARKRKDLLLKKDRMLHAIQKWTRSFATCRAQDQPLKGRNSVRAVCSYIISLIYASMLLLRIYTTCHTGLEAAGRLTKGSLETYAPGHKHRAHTWLPNRLVRSAQSYFMSRNDRKTQEPGSTFWCL